MTLGKSICCKLEYLSLNPSTHCMTMCTRVTTCSRRSEGDEDRRIPGVAWLRCTEPLFQGDKGETDRVCLNYPQSNFNYLITVASMKYPDQQLKGKKGLY